MSRVYTRERLGLTSPVIKATGSRLISVNPTFGDEAGGDTVIISGANLNGVVSAVTIGDAVASFEHVSDRQISCVTAAGSGTDDVVVTIGGKGLSLSAAFEYTASGGLPADMLHSDWTTKTGTDDDALRDTSQGTVIWATADGGPGQLSVIAATGLGFPGSITNVLKNDMSVAQSSEIQTTSLPVPAIGESQYDRWYFRCDFDPGVGTVAGGSHHMWYTQVGAETSTHGIFYLGARESSGGAEDEIILWFNCPDGPGGGGWVIPRRTIAYLDRDTVYRIERHWYRVDADNVNLHMRLYDAAGDILYDDDTIGSDTNEYLADAGSINIGESDIDTYFDIWSFGENSAGWAAGELYVAAYAHRTDDWCGPHDAQESV